VVVAAVQRRHAKQHRLADALAHQLAHRTRSLRRVGPRRPGQHTLEWEAERAQQRLAEVLAGWKERDITAFAGMIERFLTDVG
jgi:hypothetical protein